MTEPSELFARHIEKESKRRKKDLGREVRTTSHRSYERETQYTLLRDNGNPAHDKHAFINTFAFTNRFTRDIRNHYQLTMLHLGMLAAIYSLCLAKDKFEPIALYTYKRNFYVPFHQYKNFLGYLMHLRDSGMCHLEYTGKMKGSKVTITVLGKKIIDDLFLDYENVMSMYPEKK